MSTRRSVLAQGELELTFDLQEGGQKLVLILLGGYGIGELLAIIERLQKGLKAII